MEFKNITVAGSGVLGYQIAFQSAFHGFNVTVYDIHEQALDAAKAKFSQLCEHYKKDVNATQAQLDETFSRLSYLSNLAEAVKDADLLIEAVPEDVIIKRKFYAQLSQVAPEKTIFATNTSTLLPSQFAQDTGRPEKFLALHFANLIWVNNMAEIMKHAGTDPEVFDAVVEFAKAIDMLPLPIYKEQPALLLNSLLVPFCISALSLWVNEISDIQTIDKSWMKSFASPKGPFAIMDIIGMTTVYNVALLNRDNHPDMPKVLEKIQTEFIDQGHLGLPSGRGFYHYPNPAYEAADFLSSHAVE